MNDEERSWEEHEEQAEEWVTEVEENYNGDDYALSEALYTFSELGLWKMDIEIKEVEEAIRVWAVVEKVRRDGFPEELRM